MYIQNYTSSTLALEQPLKSPSRWSKTDNDENYDFLFVQSQLVYVYNLIY